MDSGDWACLRQLVNIVCNTAISCTNVVCWTAITITGMYGFITYLNY